MTQPVIAYCTNVHAGANLAQMEQNLAVHAAKVRALVAPDAPLPIGLWLSAAAAAELTSAENTRRLRDRIEALGLAVVTLNGFPFSDFHQSVVKHRVYEPHWADSARRAFTIQLANILVDLLPDGVRDASISTLPIGWRATFSDDPGGLQVAAAQLEAVASHLHMIEMERGVLLHVDLEPEPGCVLDRAQHVVDFFDRWFGSASHVRRHIGVCHDICHSAVMFEDQTTALDLYRDAAIRVGKVQVSSAVESDGAASGLALFDEERYLHQTCVRMAGGNVRFFEDLGLALEQRLPGTHRTHFHVPIFLSSIDKLRTTQIEIGRCLRALRAEHAVPVLEIETYAWSVLPATMRPASLADGIAREVRWLQEQCACM
ncbi:MAG: metabolite traffic protein EboE [Phycisphaerae bacterium]|nr:metabolite traffic protein EboE [Phycisphaerae bacterium]